MTQQVPDMRLVVLQAQMARNVRFEQEMAARRRAARLGGWLGTIAAALAIYDLMLLATAGH